MLKKSLYTLVLFTAIFMSVNCKRRITTRPTPTNIDYDVSSVTRTIIREMMRKFSADLAQWKQKNIPIDDADMEDILTAPPTGKNYSIEYGKISVTRDLLDFPDNSKNIEIICEFGDKLQVQMPLSNFKFKGYFNIATENSMPVEYKYSIVINDVKINFITEFSYDINDTTSSDTKSHIDMSYEPITINLEMPENNEYAAYTEVNGISRNIVSALKTVLHEKSTLLLEDAGVLRLCRHPKTYIAQNYHPFTTEEQQRFYYYMSNIRTESCALLGMHINTIKVKGLWNFSSVTAKLNSNDNMDFKLQIDDIEGETHWGYFIGEEKNMKFDESNFNMNIMLIEAQMYIHDSRPHAMHINGDVILEDTSNNSSVALLNEILSKKLNSVILSKLESDIWERF